MRDLLRSLSTPAEAAVVIAVAFGYFIFAAVYTVIESIAEPHITNDHLLALLIIETPIIVLLGVFLKTRGWTLARLGLALNVMDTAIGMGLAVVFLVVNTMIWMLLRSMDVSPSYLSAEGIVSGTFSIPIVIGASLVNALYEEMFVCAYIISVAKENERLAFGVNASVAIRLSYHLYQGGVGVITIIPFGLMCAWWFAKTGRIWPIVVAHAGIDIIALTQSSA
jgi:membrane protease YdiL (CAAX protease family)